MPRSTIAKLETGASNPTLAVLLGVAAALGIGVAELLSPPTSMGRHYPSGSLPRELRGRSERAEIRKLLPDPIPGMEIDRMELPAGTTVTGVPHRPGTQEYLCCERGTVLLATVGHRFELRAGDVGAFEGDQRHQYTNVGGERAVLFSVVVLALAGRRA